MKKLIYLGLFIQCSSLATEHDVLDTEWSDDGRCYRLLCAK